MATPDHDHERWRDGVRDELREFEQAAIDAELETGRREETVEEAKRHLLVRVVRITAGVLVCGVGIALLVLPGPGLVVLAAGLTLLAQDVPFARRLLDRVRDRLPEDEDGEVSKVFIVVCSAGGVLFMVISVWWTLIR
jgi:Flp pilus assembly protein TadB